MKDIWCKKCLHLSNNTMKAAAYQGMQWKFLTLYVSISKVNCHFISNFWLYIFDVIHIVCFAMQRLKYHWSCSSISHTLCVLYSILEWLYSDSDLISNTLKRKQPSFFICKKIYRTTAGSEKTCFQQQQN